MNGFHIVLIAAFFSPLVGFTQYDGNMKDGLRVVKPTNRVAADSILSESMTKHVGDRVFDPYPMPNAYRGDYAVAMPNIYRGDNCVPMPNLYQGKPTGYIIEVDSIGGGRPDSVLVGKYEKAKETLRKQQPTQQRLRAEQP